MPQHMLNAITQNPWILAVGTVAFFALKGTLWLLIPFLVIRWRRLSVQRRIRSELPTPETTAQSSVTAFASQSKRAEHVGKVL